MFPTSAAFRHRLLAALAASVLAGAWGLATAPPLAGQEVEREVQVPLDSVRAIVEVSPELRRELGLFPEVEGFVAARLFVTRSGREILEISYRESGRLVRERRPVTAADLEGIRERIAARMAARGMRTAVERDGRGGLVLAETVLGLGYYGWALADVMNIEDDRGRVATYLLTAGASFVVPYALTRSIAVREAHRDAVVWGGTRGILYGALLGDAITGGEDTGDEVLDEDGDRRTILGLGILGSIGGQVLGYSAVQSRNADRGEVALWSTVGDLSLAYGFGTAYVLGLYDGETRCEGDLCTVNETERRPAGHAATMAVGLAGLWMGRRWSEAEDYTVGDARALLSAGLLGAQVVAPLSWALLEGSDDGEKPFAATLVAGSAAGLWLGNRFLRDYALTPSEGLLVQAGHVAGGLAGLGIAYLFDADTDADELVYLTASTVGSVAGAWLTFRAVAAESRAAPGTADAPRDRGPTVEVSALGAAPVLLSGLGGGSSRPSRIPLVTVRW